MGAAAPVYNYAAMAPTTQVASYVAPPVAAPMMTTMAAPTYAAAAPVMQMTTQAPSFVAPPVMPATTMPMPAGIVPPAPPAMPVKLTEGIPTPEQIAAQKAGYAAALDKQLAEAVQTVQKETAIEKEM